MKCIVESEMKAKRIFVRNKKKKTGKLITGNIFHLLCILFSSLFKVNDSIVNTVPTVDNLNLKIWK